MTKLRIPHEFRRGSSRNQDSICFKCSTTTPDICELCAACYSCHSGTKEKDY